METPRTADQTIDPAARNRVVGISSLALIILCVVFSIYRQNPPDPQAADAPPSEFASGRAMEHLKVIARRPHPVGSEEHSEVRNYILKELEKVGLNPEIQKSLALNWRREDSYAAAVVENIIGRIKGINGPRAVLLSCHYDSVPTGTGANDDGASVAALLEVIRAVKTGPPLNHDVIFLFTDAEEVGLLGATAFMNESSCAKDVAVALNFEARGIGGPSIMFETSEGNGWLIKEFARAASHPVTNSLTNDLYKLLPNDTDLTVFKEGGLPGLNFAYVTGPSFYHTARDSYENVDQRSLQHQGASALALVRRLGNLEYWPPPAKNAVYFDILNSFLIFYPSGLVLPLMTLGVVFFAGLLILGLRMKRLTIRKVVLGALAFLVNLLAVGIVMTVIWILIQTLSSNPTGGNYYSDLYAVGFLLLTIALTMTLLIWFRKKVGLENLVVGALLWWLIVTVLVCLFAPGGSYLYNWPLLLMLLGVGLVFITREEMTSAKGLIFMSVPALSGVVLMAPMIRLMVAGFGIQAVGVIMAIAIFPLALHYAHLSLLIEVKKWLLPMASGFAALCLIVSGILMTGVSANHPKRNHIFYAMNADTGKAMWGSADQSPDEWTAQFFSPKVEKADLADYFPWRRGAFLKSDAIALPLAPPSLVAIEDRTAGGVRTMRLRLTSTRKAPAVSIYWKREVELELLAVNGKRAIVRNIKSTISPVEYRSFSCTGLPEEGIELSFEVRSSGRLELEVEDRSYGLPQIPGVSLRDRPDYLIASPAQYSDCTVVTKSVRF